MTGQPKSVIVTGGSRGLGAAVVEAFLDAGDRVATCSRSSTPAIETWAEKHGDRFLHREFDARDRDASRAFVKDVRASFGRIDVLVNNAGVAEEGVLALASEDDIDDVVDLNVKATIFLTKLVVRRMLPQESGRIINISSIVGRSGYRGLAIYSATKAALDGFTRAMAREVGARGITVNSVAPGYVRTDMTVGLDDAQLEQIVRRTPLGRLAEPADVVACVRFLASDDAAFVTGHVLVVDGGLTS